MKMFKYFNIIVFLLFNLVVFSQGSNTCLGSQTNQVTLPFFGNNQSLCGDLNDYNGLNACATPTGGGNYYGGQDWLYSFTPSQDGFINCISVKFSVSKRMSKYDTVYNNCISVSRSFDYLYRLKQCCLSFVRFCH